MADEAWTASPFMSREKWLGGWAAAHFLFFALLWALPAIYAGITGK